MKRQNWKMLLLTCIPVCGIAISASGQITSSAKPGISSAFTADNSASDDEIYLNSTLKLAVYPNYFQPMYINQHRTYTASVTQTDHYVGTSGRFYNYSDDIESSTSESESDWHIKWQAIYYDHSIGNITPYGPTATFTAPGYAAGKNLRNVTIFVQARGAACGGAPAPRVAIVRGQKVGQMFVSASHNHVAGKTLDLVGTYGLDGTVSASGANSFNDVNRTEAANFWKNNNSGVRITNGVGVGQLRDILTDNNGAFTVPNWDAGKIPAVGDTFRLGVVPPASGGGVLDWIEFNSPVGSKRYGGSYEMKAIWRLAGPGFNFDGAEFQQERKGIASHHVAGVAAATTDETTNGAWVFDSGPAVTGQRYFWESKWPTAAFYRDLPGIRVSDTNDNALIDGGNPNHVTDFTFDYSFKTYVVDGTFEELSNEAQWGVTFTLNVGGAPAAFTTKAKTLLP